MADAKRTIELVFEGVDKTGAATQAALKNTQQFAGSIQGATQPIADFTFAALKFEAALLATGAAITAFSVKLAGDFQSAVADLSKVLSETDNIETYKDLALEMSEAYGVASVDVLNAISNYKQAGFTAEEAGQLTKAGLDLVIAGGIGAAEAADLLVASIKGFGAEASDSAQIVDLLNQVSNEYASSTEQLLEGFSVLSPVAKAAGLSLEETIGILTPGIEVFQSGSEVANALRTSLLRLVDDSAPVQEGLAALGVSQRDANGELRSARDIYFDVAAALQNVDENQKLYIASQLVGIQRSSQFLAITDGLDKTLRIAGDGFNYLGSAAKEVELQLATAENAANRAKESFTNLFIGIGTPLLDEFSGVADALSAIFQAMGDSAKSDTGIGGLVEFIESQFAGMQSALETVAKNLPAALEQADFSGFTSGIQAITDSIGALFGGVDLSTVDGLAKAITAVGNAFNGLSQFTAGVIDSFKPLADVFFDVGSGLGDIDEAAFRSAGEMAGFVTQLNLLSGPAVTAAAALIAFNQALALGASITGVTAALGAVGGAGLLGALGSLAALGAAGAAGFGVGSLISDGLDELTDSLTDTEESLGTWLYSLVNGAEETERVAALMAPLPAAIRDVGGAADESVGSLWDLESGIGRLDDEFGTIADLSQYLEPLPASFDAAAGSVEKLGAAAEKLSLEEKLAFIEAQTAITTASIEADAKVAVAAFESISVSVQSTGESITDLFGLLGDENISKLDKLDIKDQIEEENKRRQEALDLQKKLTEQEIALAKARREAISRGDATITVNGDGLQPHLEAFMWEILQSIQVRVNADGLGMLLGAP